jgi:hypothetical protein
MTQDAGEQPDVRLGLRVEIPARDPDRLASEIKRDSVCPSNSADCRQE